MRRVAIISLCVLFASLVHGQQSQPMTKSGERQKFIPPARGMETSVRLKGFELRQQMESASRFANLKFHSVGPEIQSCRIVDVEIPKDAPDTIIAAYASGGLWRSDNQGTSWESIFDKQSSMTIGDIAVVDSKTIWVGTGENNSSRTSYSGTGVFVTKDGGKTWTNTGLSDSHHIGRIVVDRSDSNILYVAALGHLYTENEERGVYKTIDGGKTWQRVLYVNESTGAIDIVQDPRSPGTLYAAMWERARRAGDFLESGPGSGIYKTTDTGAHWQKLPFPSDEYTGRIGLAICSALPNIVYATFDNQRLRPDKEIADEDTPTGELTIARLKKLTKEQFLALDKGVLTRFLRGYEFPADLKAEDLVEKIKKGEVTLADLIDYSHDADQAMVQSNIIGPEVYRSNDGGQTWVRTHEARLDQFFYTYGYYFGQIRVAPDNPDRIYLMGVPLIASDDGGKTFHGVDAPGVHGDHHALWIDPANPKHLVLGNDGGLNFSWDAGTTWRKINNVPVGQFTTVAVDMAEPYNIYGGLQDNGVIKGPSTYRPGRSDPWEWKEIYGGDGGAVQVDTRDNATVYTEGQFGSAGRVNTATQDETSIRPKHALKEPALRFNWVSPILLSPHSSEIVYFGTNRVHRSLDKGDHWTAISGDLTSNLEQGDVPFGTVTTISESPKTFGLIYAGTDEGKIWGTRDGGFAWTDLGAGLAPGRWVTRVIASNYQEATVYATQNGYRNDDFAPLVWKSTDYGKTWTSIAGGLPAEPVNVIREDPKNENVIYVGTDMGCFVSLDKGAHWDALAGDLPGAPVHDLVIQPREADLVLGTHGRSVFVANVAVIQALTGDVLAKDLHVFGMKEVTASLHWGYGVDPWVTWWQEPPEAPIRYWLKTAGAAQVAVKDDQGNVLREWSDDGEAGLNVIAWDLTLDRVKAEAADKAREAKAAKDKKAAKNAGIPEALRDPFVAKRSRYTATGTYTIEVRAAGKVETTKLEVKPPKEDS